MTDQAKLVEELLKEAIFYGTDPDAVIVGLEAALKLSRLLTRAADLLASKDGEIAKRDFLLSLALVRAQFAEGNRVLAANHAETLRGIAAMDPATEGARMVQWAREGLWGYVEDPSVTVKDAIERAQSAEDLTLSLSAENERLREVVPELLAHSVAHYGNPKDETYGVGLTHAKARAALSQSTGDTK